MQFLEDYFIQKAIYQMAFSSHIVTIHIVGGTHISLYMKLDKFIFTAPHTTNK